MADCGLSHPMVPVARRETETRAFSVLFSAFVRQSSSCFFLSRGPARQPHTSSSEKGVDTLLDVFQGRARGNYHAGNEALA